MQTVNIDKIKLIEVLKVNKEKHVAEYKEAVLDFANLVINISNHNKDIIEDGVDFEKLKTIPSAPISYEDSYIKALLMLEYSVDTVIGLDTDDFEKLVQDNWDWKHRFSLSNSIYKTGF